LLSIALFTLFYTLILIFDLIPLAKKKKWKAYFLTLPIFILTYVVSILYALNVDIPSPATPIKDIITFIFKIKS